MIINPAQYVLKVWISGLIRYIKRKFGKGDK